MSEKETVPELPPVIIEVYNRIIALCEQQEQPAPAPAPDTDQQ